MAKLHFHYAAMNAGKSTFLLQLAHNYNQHGQAVALYTSAQDDRDGVGVISSRIGVKREAKTFTKETRFTLELERLDGLACVLIDESQFMTAAQVKELHQWAHRHDVPVHCFGLRSDFQGNSFEGSAALLAIADNLEEIKTMCGCGRKASMNLRLDASGRAVRTGEQVLIGGNDRYKQVCGKCFYDA